MSKHIDCTGVEIRAGDFIVYSVTCGHSTALRFGLVKELKWQNNKVDGHPKLSCVAVEKSWRSKGWELQSKKVSLQVVQTLVLRPDTVLPEIRDLLMGAP